MDLLLGRIGNGCGSRWDIGSDSDGDDSDEDDSDEDDTDDDGDLDEDLNWWSEVDGDGASGSLAEQSAVNCDERPTDAADAGSAEHAAAPTSEYPEPADAGSVETAPDPVASVGHGSSNGRGSGAGCDLGVTLVCPSVPAR